MGSSIYPATPDKTLIPWCAHGDSAGCSSESGLEKILLLGETLFKSALPEPWLSYFHTPALRCPRLPVAIHMVGYWSMLQSKRYVCLLTVYYWANCKRLLPPRANHSFQHIMIREQPIQTIILSYDEYASPETQACRSLGHHHRVCSTSLKTLDDFQLVSTGSPPGDPTAQLMRDAWIFLADQ